MSSRPAGRPVFHDLLCTLESDGLAVEVRGLEKNGESVVTRDRFLLRWPEVGSREAS
jgi:hypothetical protein